MALSYTVLALSLRTLVSDASTGKATFYGGNVAGNACGFIDIDESTFPYGFYAATGSDNHEDGYGCGRCYRITCLGPYGTNPGCSCSSTTPSVVVQALDKCPECSNDHFDLDPTAMARIVGDGLSGTCGVISIEYERVSCDYKIPFSVRNKGGVSKYWYGLHVDDVAGNGGVSQIKLGKDGVEVGSCNKDNGPSYWGCTANSGSFPDMPMDITLIDETGASVTASNCITSYSAAETTPMTCDTNFPTTSTSDGSTPSGDTNTNTDTNTPLPTPSPVQSPADSDGSAVSITVSNKNGLNAWWYAVVLTVDGVSVLDVAGLSVSSVEMRCNSCSDFETGEAQWDYYKFDANPPYDAPFTIRITANGETSTATISSIAEGDSATTTSTFTLNAAYVERVTVTGDSGDGVNWTVVLAVALCAAMVVFACVVFVFCVWRRTRPKVEVTFEDKDVEVEDWKTVTQEDPEEDGTQTITVEAQVR